MHSNGAERFLPGSQNLTESRIQSRSERRSHATLETPDRAAGVLLQPYKYSECGGDYDCGFQPESFASTPTEFALKKVIERLTNQQEERKQIHATIFFCLYDSSSDGFTSVNVDIWGDATHARWGDFVHSLTHSTRTSAKIRDFWTPSLPLEAKFLLNIVKIKRTYLTQHIGNRSEYI